MNAFQHCSGLQHSENQIALASSALHATCDTFWHSFNMLISGARLSYASWQNETRQDGAKVTLGWGGVGELG